MAEAVTHWVRECGADTILPELELLEAKQQQHSVIPKGVTAPELADMVMRGEVKLSPQQMRAMVELLPFHAPKLTARSKER